MLATLWHQWRSLWRGLLLAYLPILLLLGIAVVVRIRTGVPMSHL